MSDEQTGRWRTTAVFRAFASPRTTLAIVIGLLALTTAGMVLPQDVPYDLIGDTYSSSVSQAVRSLDLHHVALSWPAQLLAILLVLNLIALWASRASAPLRTGIGGFAVEDTDLPGPTPEERPREAALAEALGGWRTTVRGLNHVSAMRGLAFEGALCLAVATLLFVAALYHADVQGTNAHLSLVTGSDAIARSRFHATKRTGDRQLPWKPPFEMACFDPKTPALLAPRECLIQYEGTTHQGTVTPGRDLEFLGLRLTLVGVRRLSGVGGFRLDARQLMNQPFATVASIGTPLDVSDGDALLTTLLVSGNAPGDPVGVLPGPGVPANRLAAMELTAEPRVQLEFRVASVSSLRFNLVVTGLLFLLFGLVLTMVVPSYRVMAHQGDTGRWRLAVAGFGLLGRPRAVLDRARAGLQRQGRQS